MSLKGKHVDHLAHGILSSCWGSQSCLRSEGTGDNQSAPKLASHSFRGHQQASTQDLPYGSSMVYCQMSTMSAKTGARRMGTNLGLQAPQALSKNDTSLAARAAIHATLHLAAPLRGLSSQRHQSHLSSYREDPARLCHPAVRATIDTAELRQSRVQSSAK